MHECYTFCLALEADQSKSIEQLFSTLPEAKDENYFEDSSQDSPSYTSSENSAYTEVFRGSPDTENLPRRGHIRRESLTPTGKMARRVPSFSPTPKPRVPRSSMSRSKSYDQLAVEGTEGKTATNSVYSIPRKVRKITDIIIIVWDFHGSYFFLERYMYRLVGMLPYQLVDLILGGY